MTLAADALESAAPRVILFEESSQTKLLAAGDQTRIAPGNFAKLLTAGVVFEALDKGEITEATTYKISEHAWRLGGAPAGVTTMFAAVRSEVSVGDLLRGLVIDYANDAAIVLAEGMAGSDAAFAARMNALAARIGMKDSHFANPTGFVDPSAHTTLDDLLKFTRWLQATYPERYRLYAQPDFLWNKITQTNKTRQLKEIAGADGLMLAYDEKDGFAAVISILREGRRVTLAVSGLKSAAERDKELKALADGAFTEYARVELFPAAAEVGKIRVFGGAVGRVGVGGVDGGPVAMTLPTGDRSAFHMQIVFDGPVPAPVHKGQVVARLEMRVDNRVYQTLPLAAVADVPEGDIPRRALDGFMELLFGWW
ncbi:D-alanyl-D-alanine carboxypeptidase family protein [Oryzibacter oryziterrae]|uniref:D-alanyl-D-alanine carboxypeptidase family protein n=1 Tax=Oryzibacter oryziterrae TaxID=2766474 RepID=UPI001F2EE577|nr:D-alanyl-D-alanine carboxypeptidase family protein [Oryzibacter oryziterrae]